MSSSRLIKLTLIFTVLGLAIFSGFAAAKGSKYADKAAEHLAFLKTNLNLSDVQAEKVKAILDENQKTAMADRQKYKGNKNAFRNAALERQKSTNEKIMAVLDDNQKKEFNKIKDASWDKMKTQKTQTAPKTGY